MKVDIDKKSKKYTFKSISEEDNERIFYTSNGEEGGYLNLTSKIFESLNRINELCSDFNETFNSLHPCTRSLYKEYLLQQSQVSNKALDGIKGKSTYYEDNRLFTKGKSPFPRTYLEMAEMYLSNSNDKEVRLFRNYSTFKICNNTFEVCNSNIDPYILNQRLDALFDSYLIAIEEDNLIDLCMYHMALIYLHPFYYGSDEFSRFIFSLSLVDGKYYPLSICLPRYLNDKKNEYFIALKYVFSNEYTYFNSYIIILLDIFIKGLEEDIRAFKTKLCLYDKQLNACVDKGCGDKELNVIRVILERLILENKHDISFHEIKDDTGVSARQIDRLCSRLNVKEILEKSKVDGKTILRINWYDAFYL